MVEERARTIYCNMEGYDPTAATLFTLDPGAPKDLPDALRGEQWAFVQLPLSAVLKELEVRAWGLRAVGLGRGRAGG